MVAEILAVYILGTAQDKPSTSPVRFSISPMLKEGLVTGLRLELKNVSKQNVTYGGLGWHKTVWSKIQADKLEPIKNHKIVEPAFLVGFLPTLEPNRADQWETSLDRWFNGSRPRGAWSIVLHYSSQIVDHANARYKIHCTPNLDTDSNTLWLVTDDLDQTRLLSKATLPKKGALSH